MTEKGEEGPVEETRHIRLRTTGELVNPRLHALQGGYLADNPSSRAAIAELRRSVNQVPGQNPTVWKWTEVPSSDFAGDDPTREEWATHLTLTLYALHQQGRAQKAHVRGMAFGTAVKRLADVQGASDSLWQRFAAVVAARDIPTLRENLQALIGQMHSNKAFIGFDYATFADDLVSLQDVRYANLVRLRWERDYYRRRKETKNNDPSPTTSI